jgi:hypothetical protein
LICPNAMTSTTFIRTRSTAAPIPFPPIFCIVANVRFARFCWGNVLKIAQGKPPKLSGIGQVSGPSILQDC